MSIFDRYDAADRWRRKGFIWQIIAISCVFSNVMTIPINAAVEDEFWSLAIVVVQLAILVFQVAALVVMVRCYRRARKILSGMAVSL